MNKLHKMSDAPTLNLSETKTFKVYDAKVAKSDQILKEFDLGNDFITRRDGYILRVKRSYT